MQTEFTDLNDLPAIPPRLRSMDGQEVDTRGDLWRLRASADGGKFVTIEWARLEKTPSPPALTERARMLVRIYMAERIKQRKASTVRNDYEAMLRFARWLARQVEVIFPTTRPLSFNWSDLTEGIMRGFLAEGITHTACKGDDFYRLRRFYEWGVVRQYPDFDAGLLRLLKSITTFGNPLGHHVRFRDQFKGPFSPDELLLIRRAIQAGAGTDRDRAVVMLHLELGLNPNATARLRKQDLKRYETDSGVFYQLDVPRVKKRTARRESRRCPISLQLGRLLENLRPEEADGYLLHWLTPAHPEHAVNQALCRFGKAAGLISPRTGGLLKLNARRFRFTLATQKAEEGASKFAIAVALDHADLSYVNVYVETASSIADPVAQATDTALLPLVRRFQGKIVDDISTSAFAGLPNQMIPAAAPHLPILSVTGLGMCGRDIRRDGLCRLFPPLSCYLCPSFAALQTGPHQEMLDSIETVIHQGEETLDRRVVMQLDEIRLAIKQVIDQIALTSPRVNNTSTHCENQDGK
jgi:integrase